MLDAGSSPRTLVVADKVEQVDGEELLDLLGRPLLRANSLRKVTVADLPLSVRPLDART